MLIFFSLTDVNECEPDEISEAYKYLAHNCHNDSECTNTNGSFYCTCLEGYSGDGVLCTGKLNKELDNVHNRIMKDSAVLRLRAGT